MPRCLIRRRLRKTFYLIIFVMIRLIGLWLETLKLGFHGLIGFNTRYYVFLTLASFLVIYITVVLKKNCL